MWAKQKQTGFTIVELLIVIVVIAILASITIVAFNGVQARARDSERKADLAALAKATKLYAVDKGDHAEANCGNGTGTGWHHRTVATAVSASAHKRGALAIPHASSLV